MGSGERIDKNDGFLPIFSSNAIHVPMYFIMSNPSAKTTFFLLPFLLLMLACEGPVQQTPITWNDRAITKLEEFQKVTLEDHHITAYISKIPGNKDAVIFLNNPELKSDGLYIYNRIYFNTFGFDNLMLDYAPADSIHYSYGEMIAKIRSGINYLGREGFPPEKIVIYGKDKGCMLAVKTALQVPVRGIALENPPDCFFDEIRKDIANIKCRTLLLHGVLAKDGDWHNSVKLYEVLLKKEVEARLSIFHTYEMRDMMDNLSADDFSNFFPSEVGLLPLVTKPDF
jgi:hypothetical protein